MLFLCFLGLFLCPACFVIFAALGMDNWNAGNYRFALVAIALAIAAAWGLSASLNGIENAYFSIVDNQEL